LNFVIFKLTCVEFFPWLSDLFGVGIYAVILNPGLDGIAAFALERPSMFSLNAVGNQVIFAWMGTFLVNVILAQAAFQMAHLNIHPVWVGMSANLLTIMVITLIQKWDELIVVPFTIRPTLGYLALAGAAIVLSLLVINFYTIYYSGLLGIFLFSFMVILWIGVMKIFPELKEGIAAPEWTDPQQVHYAVESGSNNKS